MRVKLVILHGSNAGKEVKIPAPKCVIGRGDGCHLRPKSDAISRKHCAFLITESRVLLRDLKSRNGTYVDGRRIEADVVLKGGEHVRIGPLEFQVVVEQPSLDDTKPKAKASRVHDVARRAAAADARDEDITDWLLEADELERERRLADPETRNFRLDDTNQVSSREPTETVLEEDGAEDDDDAAESDPQADKSDENAEAVSDDDDSKASGVFGFGGGKKKKKTYGKLPDRPAADAESSTKAAEDMLKKFFNRR